MEFHFPHFELRELSSNAPNQPEQLIDVSFLNSNSTSRQDKRRYGIYDVRFSLLICGADHVDWTAFAFFESTASSDMEDACGDDYDFEADPIASPNGDDPRSGFVDANIPIYDPREYYLRVMENRLRTGVKKCQNTISWMERQFEEYVRPSRILELRTCSRHSGDTKSLHFRLG